MKKTIKDKAAGVNRWLSEHTLLSSLILCVFFFLIYFAISGFNIISGNDDYCIFKLIFNGEGVGCVGYFFTSFISLIQPLFGKLNSYMIIHELICASSLLAINYVILSKLKSKIGLFLIICFDIVYFSFYILEILFTFTAIVACAAGMLLIIYASLYENRKKYMWLQIVCGIILTLTGSQVRILPMQSICAIIAALAICVLLVSVLKLKKESGLKKAAAKTVKRYLKTGVLLAVAIIIAFSADFASNNLKHTMDGYDEYSEYNSAIAGVIDYNTAGYFTNKDFYEKQDIHTVSDIEVLKSWFIDDEFFTAEKLKAIKEYSREHLDDGIANEGKLSYILEPVKDTLKEITENGLIIIYAIALLVVIFAVVFLLILLPKQRAKTLRVSLLIVLWVFYLLISSGFSLKNIAILPLMFITFYIALRYNNYQYIITVALTVVAFVLYFYLMTLRLLFYSSLAMILPITALVIFTLNEKDKIDLSKYGKKAKIPYVIVAVLLIAASIFTGAFLFKEEVYVSDKTSNPKLIGYIKEHPDELFVINQTKMFKDYYEPFIVPEEKDNLINYGLWVTRSKYIQGTYKKHNIKHVFRESIDSNMRIVIGEIKEKDENNNLIDNGISPYLEDYYNEHYAEKGKEIVLKKTGTAGQYSFYKVVTKKAEKKNN